MIIIIPSFATVIIVAVFSQNDMIAKFERESVFISRRNDWANRTIFISLFAEFDYTLHPASRFGELHGKHCQSA